MVVLSVLKISQNLNKNLSVCLKRTRIYRIYTDISFHLELENYFLTDNHLDDCFVLEQRFLIVGSVLKARFQKHFSQRKTIHQKIIRAIRAIRVPRRINEKLTGN